MQSPFQIPPILHKTAELFSFFCTLSQNKNVSLDLRNFFPMNSKLFSQLICYKFLEDTYCIFYFGKHHGPGAKSNDFLHAINIKIAVASRMKSISESAKNHSQTLVIHPCFLTMHL